MPLELFPICGTGKTLRLPTSQPHMYQVIYGILKQVYLPLVPDILEGLPQGWSELLLDQNQVAECAKKYNMAAKPDAKNVKRRRSYSSSILKEWGHRQCTFGVARDIVNFAYECAVPRPSQLNNHYKSFSSETYGETNLEQMASIIDELRLGPSDVFVDLGSGVGQLVCFAAAYSNIKQAVGIELSPLPAGRAVDLSNYFKKIMDHFGKNCGALKLIHGDFLDPKFKKLITEEATVIYINNLAFGPELMLRITLELLQELKPGTRIVSTKPFGSRKRVTYRSTCDLSAISDTVQMRSLVNGVSWTANKVDFWLTTMVPTKLYKYYESELHKKKGHCERSEAGEQNQEHGRKKRKTELRLDSSVKKSNESGTNSARSRRLAFSERTLSSNL
uniref:Histone-lysine N-methyltransferase, H3 lysine-79 specific n=2 Tax=Caenorhabditis japonica TaxID=281687 RepID=A0A8R1E0Z6_CAEJA